MSCWVVPSLAAEYWGIPLEQVMTKVTSGEIHSRDEHGFTLIDVAPGSPPLPESRNPFYPPMPATVPSGAVHESQLPHAVEEISEAIEAEMFGDWRLARQHTSLRRKAPALVN